jgi:cellulose synthase/poly-beta-1,6-N-acetylglucosamine synthase-like glycosyltransferase
MPLGGTSNHFRTSVLREIKGWDPFNVTEDADLGIRLSRLGMRVKTLDSTTYEEATNGVGNWLRQRTRWLKGYMQTSTAFSVPITSMT